MKAALEYAKVCNEVKVEELLLPVIWAEKSLSSFCMACDECYLLCLVNRQCYLQKWMCWGLMLISSCLLLFFFLFYLCCQLILFGEIVLAQKVMYEKFGDDFLVHFVSKGFPSAHCPQNLVEQYCQKLKVLFSIIYL